MHSEDEAIMTKILRAISSRKEFKKGSGFSVWGFLSSFHSNNFKVGWVLSIIWGDTSPQGVGVITGGVPFRICLMYFFVEGNCDTAPTDSDLEILNIQKRKELFQEFYPCRFILYVHC